MAPGPVGSNRPPATSPQAPTKPPAAAESPSAKTGGASDGGSWLQTMWRKITDALQHSRVAQATLLTTTLVGAAFGLQPSSPRPELPAQGSPAATPAATAAVSVARATAAAFDPCTLVTTAEAQAILEKPVTLQGLPPPSAQCTYKPQSQVVFTFAHPQCGAAGSNIRIDDVVLTFSTGADAAERYAAKDARYGRDPTYDQRISGLGDKAVVTGTELSVLQGPAFLNVKPSGTIDCASSGVTRFEDVYQKYVAILIAFARPALPRLAAAVAPSAAPPTQAAAATQAAQASPASAGGVSSPGPDLVRGLVGAIAGLLLGALAVGSVAARGGAAEDGPEEEGEGPDEEDGETGEGDEFPPRPVGDAQGQGLGGLQDAPVSFEPAAGQTQVEQPTLPPGEVFAPSGGATSDMPPIPATLEGIDARIEELRRLVYGDIEHAPQEKFMILPGLDASLLPYIEELERLQNARVALTGEGVAQPDLPPGETFTPEPKKPDLPTM
jgi:hypothetical protein